VLVNPITMRRRVFLSVNKRVIFWEEPYLRPNNIEDVKCLMSGTTFSTDIKYQSCVEIEKTPVLVTANKLPWSIRLIRETFVNGATRPFATHITANADRVGVDFDIFRVLAVKSSDCHIWLNGL